VIVTRGSHDNSISPLLYRSLGLKPKLSIADPLSVSKPIDRPLPPIPIQSTRPRSLHYPDYLFCLVFDLDCQSRRCELRRRPTDPVTEACLSLEPIPSVLSRRPTRYFRKSFQTSNPGLLFPSQIVKPHKNLNL
jgi:hypothetical protein